MKITGIDEITYGASDLATCTRFLEDWGLRRIDAPDDRRVFECLNGCRVIVADPDRTAKISSPVAGRLERVAMREGAIVKKGDGTGRERPSIVT